MHFDAMSVQNRRQYNMDSVFVGEKQVAGTHLCLAVVCDGVGSTQDGAFASSFAVRTLRDWLSGLEDTARLGLRLRDLILEINRQIDLRIRQDGRQMASTVSALLLAGERFYIVHLGDSRIYELGVQELVLLTHDQSNGGRLTEYLGKTSDPEIFYNEGYYGQSRFLLCTDGLYKKTDPDVLETFVKKASKRNIHKTLENMVQYAMEQGECDNISAVLILCENGR